MTHTISYRRILGKMGYYNYQNGLIYRHLNQEGEWDEHLDRCRAFILKALDIYKPFKITVLGSGWLLELPLAEMIERTDKICLVDIVHPPEVTDQASRFKNVELLEEDVTGGLIEEVWQKSGKYSFFNKLQSPGDIIIPDYNPESDPGMVISLNILTQLESLLVTYLIRRSKIPEKEFVTFRTEIQNKHLDFLKKHNSVLVTDISEIVTFKSGTISEIPTLLADLPPCKFREEWAWNFDLKGGDYYNRRSMMKIVAMAL
jgi:hypothetical protein